MEFSRFVFSLISLCYVIQLNKAAGHVIGSKVKKHMYNNASKSNALKKYELETLKYHRFATDRKSRWAVTAHVDWRNDCIKRDGVEFCDTAVLKSDLLKPRLLVLSDFCTAMCKFVTEVHKYNEKDYPPQSLKGMVIAYLLSNWVYWKLLPKMGRDFVDFYYILDNVMKERTNKAMGKVKHCSPITNNMEDKMWREGVLGEDNREKLLETVLFLIGINFALRGGDEHKCLRRPGCDSQISVEVDSDGVDCLVFRDDPYSKTNQGGLTTPLKDPKVVYCYKNADPNRCLFHLFNKYMSKSTVPCVGRSQRSSITGDQQPYG